MGHDFRNLAPAIAPSTNSSLFSTTDSLDAQASDPIHKKLSLTPSSLAACKSLPAGTLSAKTITTLGVTNPLSFFSVSPPFASER